MLKVSDGRIPYLTFIIYRLISIDENSRIFSSLELNYANSPSKNVSFI